MGAYTFLKGVDFRAFAVNVKTIAPTQKLYQSGHAIWWYEIAPAVKTFLEENDLSGKTVALFTTKGGFGAGRSDENMEVFCSNSTLLKSISIEETALDTASETTEIWLKEIGIKIYLKGNGHLSG